MQDHTLSPPKRFQMRDSLGRKQSLNAGAEAFDFWPAVPKNTRLLVLGLGPHDADNPPYLSDISYKYTDILWLECPDFRDRKSVV